MGLLLLLLVAAAAYQRLPGSRDTGVFATDPAIPYFHYTPTGAPLGRILVVHGLDASRNVVNILSRGLADGGFEVFSIDLPGHGESRAPFHALRARDAVEQVLDHLGPDTAVVGHSLGGALLLDIAADRRIPAMVLFSPAPTPVESIQSDRILVLIGQFDPGAIRTFAPRIAGIATGKVELRELRWIGHSGALFRPWVIAGVVEWLGGQPTAEIRTSSRLLLIALMGLSGVAAGILFLRMFRATPLPEPVGPSVVVSILYYIIAALAAVSVQAFVDVASWIRLFVTDYLVGFFFLTGLLLFLRLRPRLQITGRNVLIALAAAGYVILFGLSVAGEVAHFSLSGDRWLRWPALVALSLPLFLADEVLLRPIRSRWAAAGAAIVTRLLLGAIAVNGALILNREAGFLLLLTHLVILFWIALWFSAGLVRSRTDPFSAALFAAIVQAWMFSALFITT